MCQEMESIEVETIVIPLEDGSDLVCAILDDFAVDEKTYLVLAPIEDDVIGEETYFYNYEEDGEDLILNYIDDEDELKKVAAAYEQLLSEDEE